jgi:hypothetical protein
MSRRKGTYTPDPTIPRSPDNSAASLYVGYDEEVPDPPRTLCRSCERLPIPFNPASPCKGGFAPKPDGSCRFYLRVPGSDDE